MTSFAFGSGPVWGNSLVDLHSNGALEANNGAGWTISDTGVTSFAFGGGPVWGNSLVDLSSSGVLKASTGSGWNTLDTSVISFLFGRSTLNVLEGSGNLWQYASPASKNLLDQNVVSLVLADSGFMLLATKKDGTVDQFGA